MSRVLLRAGKLSAVLGGLSGSCGEHQATVGAEPDDDGQFFSDFAHDDDLWVTQIVVAGATVAVGVADEAADDRHVAELRFPGHPELESGENVGAQFATQIGTERTFQFGTFRSRLQLGTCDAKEEAISSAFGYFNDGSDKNENGLTDDLEINFQIVCGAPTFAYLTVFTDYELNTDGQPVYRKLSHVIDFDSGNTFDSVSAESDELVSTGNDPALVFPGIFNSTDFYELGFEWHADSLRFFLVLSGTETTLWTLRGAANIPQQPVRMMYNIWHPETHWFPATELADYPAEDVVMRIDWFDYVPE